MEHSLWPLKDSISPVGVCHFTPILAEQEGLGPLLVCFAAMVSIISPHVRLLVKSGARAEKEGQGQSTVASPICHAGGVFIIDGGGAVVAQICSPAWVNETFFSKLLRFLIADCTRVTKLTQGSLMHAR